MNRHFRPERRASRRGGWTLVEVMVATMLVGVLIVPIMGVFIRTANNYYRESVRDHAWQLGQELMNEIMTRAWEDPNSTGRRFGRETDESTNRRQEWDDIDDYDGLVDRPPVDEMGSPLPDCDSYERRVEVRYVRAEGTAESIQLANDALLSVDTQSAQGAFDPITDPRPFKIVTVTVQGPVGTPIQISALRYNDGLNEQLPFVQTQMIQKVQIDIGSTANGVSGRNSVNVLNRFPGSGGR